MIGTSEKRMNKQLDVTNLFRRTEMMKVWFVLGLLIGSTCWAVSPPNVVVVFIDDMGYADIGPFGGPYPTPHLDRMAQEGMKLTDFYVSSTACTPSRSALMTGCYADRIGMGRSVVFPADERGLNPTEFTMAEMFKEAGYVTGCFGKWHLGDQPEFMPLAQGFDEYEGIPYSNDMWVMGNRNRNYPPLAYIRQDKAIAHIPDVASQAVLTDALSDAADRFIRRHKDERFFAYVPLAAVHNPVVVTKERLAAADGNDFAAQIMEIDALVGRIRSTLNELGLAENTLVFFTNDNGPARKNNPSPLRGHKFGQKYEGHMRMATLACWPGTIPAGSVCSEVGATIDLLPTFAHLAGGRVPIDRIIDGQDITAMLLGKADARSPHESLFYEIDGIRQGRWKLVVNRENRKTGPVYELYDLSADLGETNNLAGKHPEKVAELRSELDEHVATLQANTRAPGMVKHPKPLLTGAEAGELPTLWEYRNQKAERF
jgi:arylsulfatase A